MKVHFETIFQSQQRYDTCGDYWLGALGDCEFRVTKMKDWRSEAAVFLHEFVEAMLTKQHGISWQQIDNFDTNFKGDGEPGDDPKCPYREEHRTAENLERLFVEALDLHWDDHNRAVDESFST